MSSFLFLFKTKQCFLFQKKSASLANSFNPVKWFWPGLFAECRLTGNRRCETTASSNDALNASGRRSLTKE